MHGVVVPNPLHQGKLHRAMCISQHQPLAPLIHVLPQHKQVELVYQVALREALVLNCVHSPLFGTEAVCVHRWSLVHGVAVVAVHPVACLS